MSKLREKMQRDLQIKGYSISTQTAYLRHIEKYAQHFNQSPDKLGADEIKEYLN